MCTCCPVPADTPKAQNAGIQPYPPEDAQHVSPARMETRVRRIIRRMRIGTPFSAAHRHSRRHPSREQRQGHLQVATCRQ